METLDRAKRALEGRGYRVRISPRAAVTNPDLSYLAGTDEERLADLNDLLRDPQIDLVLCARGGYGSARLLDGIDYEAVRKDPKPLVGYSDITALSLALAARAGVVSFSGIMATAGHGFGEDTLHPWSEQSFWQAVGDAPFPRVMGRPEGTPPWDVLRGSGTVSGPVVPVCLSLLTSLLHTPYAPDLTGAILVAEDVHEQLYAIDRCLTQLRLAGILDGVAALLLGSFNGVTPEEDENLCVMAPRVAADLTPAHVPVASGVAYGHIPRRLTLPVGAWATVDLAVGTFTFDKPPAV
jgi:muramoyltetrapeptide carboxypeptidase